MRTGVSAVEFTEKYPPRRGWKLQRKGQFDGRDYVHGGYTSDLLKKCPVCGRYPVFEEYDQQPKVYVGYCPTCELRTRRPGTLKEAVAQWQLRKYSPDSLQVCYRPKLDVYGCHLICDKIVKDEIEDALFYARQRQDMEKGSNSWEHYGRSLRSCEEFFRTSFFMCELDADGVISDIRRALYPNISPEIRVKIPLHLDQLYKGKEIIRECMESKSSSKPQSSADMPASTTFSCGSKTTTRKNTPKMIWSKYTGSTAGSSSIRSRTGSTARMKKNASS